MASTVTKSLKRASTNLTQLRYGFDGREYTWEELESIEKRRRAILCRTEESFWRILSHWDGTCLELLLLDSLFWITVAIYVGLRFQLRYGQIPEYVQDLGSANITVIGGFLSFFLVFYVNQSHSRFFGLYDLSMNAKGRILDTATLAAATLPKESANRLVRYMNAANVAGYVGLSRTYPSSSFFERLNKTLGLVTNQELARLKDIDLDAGGSGSRELTTWSMMEVQTACNKGLLDDQLANLFRTQILGLRASIGQIADAADLPIPLFYIHFICLLSALYLPLFAVSAAYSAGIGSDVYWTADVTAGLVVVLQAIFVIGLRILGQKVNDPYGDDLVDLSVMYYITFTWQMSNRILNSIQPREVDAQVEESICRERTSIGKEWEGERNYDEFRPEVTSNESQTDGAVAEETDRPVASRFST
jgi:predicted membrane chloride channel (bestrophin family)